MSKILLSSFLTGFFKKRGSKDKLVSNNQNIKLQPDAEKYKGFCLIYKKNTYLLKLCFSLFSKNLTTSPANTGNNPGINEINTEKR